MNLSKTTRESKNLQRYMREVMNRSDESQLHYYCMKGLTSSVKRMLEMKSIDVEARLGGREDGDTCLMTAALHGHLDICRLLIDKGAQMEAKGRSGDSPLHYAAWEGSIEVVRVLCDRGADIEACGKNGNRPLHWAATCGHISTVKELIEVRNADINARNDDGRTALRIARYLVNTTSYLISHGGIE